MKSLDYHTYLTGKKVHYQTQILYSYTEIQSDILVLSESHVKLHHVDQTFLIENSFPLKDTSHEFPKTLDAKGVGLKGVAVLFLP